jgi:hypothetical protein
MRGFVTGLAKYAGALAAMFALVALAHSGFVAARRFLRMPPSNSYYCTPDSGMTENCEP